MTDVHAHDPTARSDLREEIRQGTLRRMERALAEAEAAVQGLLDGGIPLGEAQVRDAMLARDRLVASIQEVAG